ncbi:MAG TPA: HEAT repeat domain-containing protein [Candidatus Polarisedimenticolia bacterium]|nr:HEAT repeat domain-containing protein [Candidatus Polarisedimenticolia bacterium]
MTPQNPSPSPTAQETTEDKSDLKVVLQFFVVPLSLVVVLVSVFFGLQLLRGRRPDPESALLALRRYDGFLARFVGDVKRWQSGYDLSLLLRGGQGEEEARELRRLVPDLSAAFREAGTQDDLKLRRYLALALGHAADIQAADALRSGLKDADPQTRLFCAWGLMRIGDRSAVPDLRAAAADPDAGVRKMAIFALGQVGDREAGVILRNALLDGESDVRWNAALALARIGDPAGAQVLLALLDGSREKDVTLNAIRGLALLRLPEAHGPLDRLAASASDPEVKEAARLAIEAYGAEALNSAP